MKSLRTALMGLAATGAVMVDEMHHATSGTRRLSESVLHGSYRRHSPKKQNKVSQAKRRKYARQGRK